MTLSVFSPSLRKKRRFVSSASQQFVFVHAFAGKGVLSMRGFVVRCAVGKRIGLKRREGDGLTPVGLWKVRGVLLRPHVFLRAPLPMARISKAMWWNDVGGRRYNTLQIGLKPPHTEESLWRKDSLYDVVLPLSYNDSPPHPRKGSGIFIHAAREGFTPTAGCIALKPSQLRAFLSRLNRTVRVVVR